jgi:phosphate starvation-inducible PhoH-like protein
MRKQPSKRRKRIEQDEGSELDATPKLKRPGPLVAQNDSQKRYINAIQNCQLVFGLGPAGTGKTYIAGACAAHGLENHKFERIIITRPAVDAGESLGFLPGEMDEKYEPYILPFRDVLYERLGKGFVDAMCRNGRIEAAPFAYMRGRTFKDAFVILDEAQNATPSQMKLFLTRIGEGSKVVINGDESQKDIEGKCGITDAVERLGDLGAVRVVRFGREDCVRSGLVKMVLEAYEK